MQGTEQSPMHCATLYSSYVIFGSCPTSYANLRSNHHSGLLKDLLE